MQTGGRGEYLIWLSILYGWPLITPFNEQNLRYCHVQSPDSNCRIYYMVTIDTSCPAHFFAGKNHINLCRLHVCSCYIYVVTLKCILSHWSCIFIKPLNVSTALHPLRLKQNIYLHHNLLHLTFFSNLLACTKGICPLRCSTISPMLSLKVNHKCSINTIVPIIFG